MILLSFGWLLIASAYIVGGWFRSGWAQRVPLSVYNAGLMLSVGMDASAIGFALQLYGRISQIIFEGQSFFTDDPIYYLGVVLLMTGKTVFVWVASMGEGRTYSKPFWFSYWAALAAWSGFCAFYYWW